MNWYALIPLVFIASIPIGIAWMGWGYLAGFVIGGLFFTYMLVANSDDVERTASFVGSAYGGGDSDEDD